MLKSSHRFVPKSLYLLIKVHLYLQKYMSIAMKDVTQSDPVMFLVQISCNMTSVHCFSLKVTVLIPNVSRRLTATTTTTPRIVPKHWVPVGGFLNVME